MFSIVFLFENAEPAVGPVLKSIYLPKMKDKRLTDKWNFVFKAFAQWKQRKKERHSDIMTKVLLDR